MTEINIQRIIIKSLSQVFPSMTGLITHNFISNISPWYMINEIVTVLHIQQYFYESQWPIVVVLKPRWLINHNFVHTNSSITNDY